MAAQPALDSYELLLILENWALASTGATIVADSTADTTSDALTSLEAINLGSEDLSAAWRSGSIAALSTVNVTVTLGSVQPVDWVSIHRSNNRLPWQVTLKDSGGAVISTSAWTEPVIAGTGTGITGPDASWLAAASAEFRLDSFVTFPVGSATAVKTVVITFDVSTHTNAGADYVQFALPFVATRFRPSTNMILGWSTPVSPRSTVVRTDSGAKLGTFRRPQRGFAFDLPQLGPDSSEQGRVEVWRQIVTRFLVERGEMARVFCWPEPEQRQLFYDTAFVGCFEGNLKPVMSTLEWPGVTGFVIQETF